MQTYASTPQRVGVIAPGTKQSGIIARERARKKQRDPKCKAR